MWAVQLAVDYRQQFQQDVLIDLYSYRKYGHNEGDEPAFTQPRMYEVIRQKKPPRAVYAQRLAEEGVATGGEADELMRTRMARLETELERTRKEGAKRTVSAMAGLWSKYRGGPDSATPEVPTDTGLGRGKPSSPHSPRRPACRSPCATCRPAHRSGTRSSTGCSPTSR